jgi:hypothetical protein
LNLLSLYHKTAAELAALLIIAQENTSVGFLRCCRVKQSSDPHVAGTFINITFDSYKAKRYF